MLFKIIIRFLDFFPGFLFRMLAAIVAEKKSKMPFSPKDSFIVFCHTYCLDREERLTAATRNSLAKAAKILSHFPNATIVFGCCDFPEGLKEKESSLKMAFLADQGIGAERIRDVGDVSNTATEVKKGLEFLDKQFAFDSAAGIIVITEEVCASGQLLLWKRCLPKNFKFGYATIKGEWGDNCLYSAQKSPRIWLLASVFRYWLFFFFGLKAGFIKESSDK